MKGFSYFLFPPLFRIGAIMLALLGVFALIFNVDYSMLDEEAPKLVMDLGFILISMIFLSYRGRFELNKYEMKVIRKYRVFGRPLKGSVIPIPEDTRFVQIQHARKKGSGYFMGVQSFSYMIDSFDVYFVREGKVRCIIKTDFRTANKVARLIKQELGYDFRVELQDGL